MSQASSSLDRPKHASLSLRRAVGKQYQKLAFLLDGKNVQIGKTNLFSEYSTLGTTQPAISFKAGDVHKISVEAEYHVDLESGLHPTSAFGFLVELNSIYPEDRSVSEIDLTIGSFTFDGYVSGYKFDVLLFGTNYRPTHIKLKLELIGPLDPNRVHFASSDRAADYDLKIDHKNDVASLGTGTMAGGAVGGIPGALIGAMADLTIGAVGGYAVHKFIQKQTESLPQTLGDTSTESPLNSGGSSFGSESLPQSLGDTSTQSPFTPTKASDSIIEARLPVSNGRWLGERGNSPWASDNSKVNNVTHGKPIPFSNGYPDFSEWRVDHKTFDKLPGGTREADFAEGDKYLAKELGLKNQTAAKDYRKEHKLTWHHHQDTKTLELVPFDLHNNINHTGGFSLKKSEISGK